jgi:alpha-glucosidase
MGYFIKDGEGKSYVEYYWGNNASFIDLTNEKALKWWKNQLKKELIDYGVSGIWNDNNELELEDQSLDAQKIRSLYPVLMAKASWEVFKEVHSGKRPWVISRSGGAGIQKYARTWTGDNVSDWESMKYNLLMGLGLGLSGIPFYGHDIGGFYGDHPDEKQFIRWCQTAVFQPRFVIHSWNADGQPTELLSYKNSIDVLRELVELHYEFMPYIYNTAIEASISGKPIERPLALMFPLDLNIDPDSVNYMFGEDILVLSAVEENSETVECYLPENTEWRESKTGKFYRGGQTVIFDFPYKGINYLQRSGSIVFRAPECRKLNNGFFPKLTLDIIPRKGELTIRDYVEDRGDNVFTEGSHNRYSMKIDYRTRNGLFSITRLNTLPSCSEKRELKLELPDSYLFEDSGLSSITIEDFPEKLELKFVEMSEEK